MRTHRLLPPLLLLAGLGSGACTRADLFGVKEDPSLPDKITLSGTVCTDNPLERRFPVKVVFLMDASAEGSTRTCSVINQRRSQAVMDIINLYSGAAEVSFSLIKYDGDTESLTQDEFTKDLQVLANGAQRTGLPCTAGGARCQQRRFDLAMERAENLITGDLLSSDKGLRARTRYVIVLYSEGPYIAAPPPMAGGMDVVQPFCCNNRCVTAPTDPPELCPASTACDMGCHFEQEVRRMKDFVLSNGGADFVVHTSHFQGTLAPNDPLAAGCPPPANPEDQVAAQQVLARMSAAGGGAYLQFRTPAEVSFRSLEYAASGNVFVLKNLMAVNLSARPTSAGLKPDSDADGLDDETENGLGTNALRVDSDDDGVGDMLEHLVSNLGLNPTVADVPLSCVNLVKNADRDGDGLNDCEETLVGTDPTLFDTDADGYPDLVELRYGTNYLTNDVGQDSDLDGTRNGDELKAHTDPRSNDAKTRAELSYLYRVVPQGIGRYLDVQATQRVTGVYVRGVSTGTYPGVGILQFNRGNQTLAWRDYGDTQFGPEVRVDQRRRYTIHSASSVPDDPQQERSIEVEVIPELLPVRDDLDTLQVRETERQCIDWRIRNITLVHTSPRDQLQRVQQQQAGDATTEGYNKILLYFGEVPQRSPLGPGLFRVAQVDMVFVPPDFKNPDVAERNVEDQDFVLLGESAVTP